MEYWSESLFANWFHFVKMAFTKLELSMDLKSTMHRPLGNYLKARRIAAGLTQHDVSTKLGYTTPQFVSNFERGLCSPPLNAMGTLVKLYDMDPEELINLILRYQEQLLRQVLLGEKKRSPRRSRRAN